jgi:hypothetical protein
LEVVVLEDLLPSLITKPVRWLGLGFLVDNTNFRWFVSKTRDGTCFGPIIEGHNIHLTLYEKDGYFYRHVTCGQERVGWLKMRKEDFFRAIYEEYKLMLNLLNNYDLYGEAVIATDAWWKLFRDAMKEMIDVRVKSGGRLYVNLNLNYLVEVLEREARRPDQLFRIGKVIEALQSPLRDRTLLSPDGRLIVVLNGRAYIFKKSILELLESKPASVVDFFEKLERSELRPLAKAADLLGIGLLFVELERRGLLPESLGDDKKYVLNRPSHLPKLREKAPGFLQAEKVFD